MTKTFFTLAALFAAGAAHAQEQPQPNREQMRQIRAVCEADIRKACPGIMPGGGRLMACIQEKPEQLSKPCTEALQAARAARSQ